MPQVKSTNYLAHDLDAIVGSCLPMGSLWHPGMDPNEIRAEHAKAFDERRAQQRQQAALVKSFGQNLRAAGRAARLKRIDAQERSARLERIAGLLRSL